jgi:hypothetical protein
MKKFRQILLLSLLLFGSIDGEAQILEIIKAGVIKVIKAVDLKIQRLQNRTIWLQNAQKVLENTMSKIKLADISHWSQRQKDLYGKYFEELWKIKNSIATCQRVKDIINKQIQLVGEYKQAYALSRQDGHFNAGEIDYMYHVYSGILNESIKNIDQLQLVVSAYATQMSDARRWELIHQADASMDQNLSDLREFNQENIRTSLQRAKDQNDISLVKKLYGIL